MMLASSSFQEPCGLRGHGRRRKAKPAPTTRATICAETGASDHGSVMRVPSVIVDSLVARCALSVRERRSRAAALLVAGMFLVAGCGGSSDGAPSRSAITAASPATTPGDATSSAPEPGPAVSTTTPNASGDNSLSGVTFLACDAPQFQLTAYNVSDAGGAVNTLGTWNLSTPHAAFGCAPEQDGWLDREQFNSDFTALAVTNNGVPAIEDRSGNVRDVGAPASDGFGAPNPAAKTALFRPGTTELWYADGNDGDKLYAIDTSMSDPTPVPKNVPTFQGEYSFSPDGKMIVTGGRLLMAPDHRHGLGTAGSKRLAVANRPQAISPANGINLPKVPLPPALYGCHPEAFVSNQTVLCGSLDALTFSSSFTSFRRSRLLPRTGVNTAVGSPVLSPDHTRVAFVSTDSNRETAIWLVGVHGGTPTKLVDISGQGTTTTVELLAWE